MPIGGILSFALGALASLTTAWVFVSRLERLGERVGLPEGVLGLLAALATDMPEITSAVTAMIQHQRTVGASVVIGSNIFNLAALLGLSAVVAGRIRLQARAVILDGAVALGAAVLVVVVVTGTVAPAVGLGLLVALLVPYGVLLWAGPSRLDRLRFPSRWAAWATGAVAEEEVELSEALRPARGTARDLWVAMASLGVVVAASAAMERGATSVAHRYGIPDVVVGAVILAIVTSLPDAVAANYLALRGRGAAVLSTALNSNNLNVLVGLLVPATALTAVTSAGKTAWAAGWFVGMTVLVVVLAWARGGLDRAGGFLIIAVYAGFLGWLLAG